MPSRSPVSRRQVLAAGGTGLLAATANSTRAAARTRKARAAAGDGTPEQIHLTWGENPATDVVVSWASPGAATRPRVRIGQRVIPAEPRQYTDGINGETVWTYHARVGGLRPGATYVYVVTADNDSNAADPFTATFRTAPRGRAAFRFTSFGDLATPNAAWVLSYGQSAYAVDAVESFQPLFHLLNGDLCYADLNPTVQPEVWRDFGSNNQTSAASRPWMPCLGNHEVEFDNGPQGFSSYLTRYTLPDNHVPGFSGLWYSFRIGSALFVSLDADDVVYQDAGAFVAGPAALTPVTGTGNPAIEPGTSFYIRGYSGGAQTAWLERTLAAGRSDPSIDWIIVQMHQCVCSSSATGNGSDLGIRQQWLPLLDRYHVDLVLNGHDHGYERSFPVRGADVDAGHEAATGAMVNTLRPHPVTTTDSGVFDTSQGTVHLTLGCGGTDTPLDEYGMDTADGSPLPGGSRPPRTPPRQAKVFTRANRPVLTSTPGVYTRAAADAVEDATWSARRDTSTGYGIAVFDVRPDPEDFGGQTSITVTQYHAVGADPVNPATGAKGAPTPDYTEFETFTLVSPRRA
ncbi:MAG TPA: metallophosphoesterase family protein [Streptosporangiaceae bacterium]|nr:metallophosphoesterase family protein [Streptosporangiaceae bacterium]